MDLLLDIGNTRAKWVCYSHDKKLINYAGERHENGVSMAKIFKKWSSLTQPSRIIAVIVGKQEVKKSIENWVVLNWQLPIIFLETKSFDFGITNAYLEYHKLGVDRWVAMIGAKSQCSGAFCVVDCGTAVTIDVVNNFGEHLGGLIIPGVDVMQQSLVSQTSLITLESDLLSSHLLANNTSEAVIKGVYNAVAGFIERVIDDVLANQQFEMDIFLTGGNAELFCRLLKYSCCLDVLLVFKGVLVVAEDI